MATEFSFTKRAAAELSRCFNVGLNVSNKNSASTSTKKPSTANGIANNQSPASNQTGNESPTKADSNSPTESSKQTGELSRCANNTINNTSASSNSSNSSGQSLVYNSTDSASKPNNNQTSSSTTSNLFTLTNSVKSIGSAYEQNILAAKSALRSPFKSPNKSASSKSIVSNVVSSFNGLDSSMSAEPNSRPSSVFGASPQTPRKQAPKAPPKTNRARLRNYLLSLNNQKPKCVEELWKDEKFLKLLFQHFSPIDRCKLAQVSSNYSRPACLFSIKN